MIGTKETEAINYGEQNEHEARLQEQLPMRPSG
jgi:hypothetical protein